MLTDFFFTICALIIILAVILAMCVLYPILVAVVIVAYFLKYTFLACQLLEKFFDAIFKSGFRNNGTR
jgi:cobalamin biosynthesis protein CobD/CbiB